MEPREPTPRSIDEYIARFPLEVQAILQKVRVTIQEAAPEAKETISYQMPAFSQRGILVYFAALKNHIGFYPTASGIEKFQQELSEYKTSKGAAQFPLDKPIPYDLIARITRFRLEENLKKAATKNKK